MAVRGALLVLLAAVLIAGAYADAVRPCKSWISSLEEAGIGLQSGLPGVAGWSRRAAVLRPGGLTFAQGGRRQAGVRDRAGHRVGLVSGVGLEGAACVDGRTGRAAV